MRGDILALAAFLLLGALLALPFLGDELALVPFHTGTVAPWSAEAPEWVKDEPVNYNVGDKHAIIYPDATFTREQLAGARMPLWNPHNFAGIPHQANPLTAVTYPPNLLFTWVEPVTAFAILNAFHLMLAGLFAFFLCRTLGIGAGSSFAGGLAFALSGWMAVHVHHTYFVNTLTWLPLALASVERILRMRSRWALVTLAVSIGMMLLAGFPQTAMIGIWFLIAWTLVGVIRLLMTQGYVIAGRRGGLVAGFALLGVMAGGVQLLPALDYKRDVGHQDLSTEKLAADALRPAALAHLLAPEIFGHPRYAHPAPDNEHRNTHDMFGRWFLTPDDAVPGSTVMSNNYSERTFFAGTLVLLLALCALFTRRDRAAWMLTGTCIVAVLLATARPLGLLDVFRRLPGLDIGSPMRYTQLAALALPVLFAMTLDRLVGGAGRPHPRTAKMLKVAGAVIVTVGLVASAVLWVAPTWFRDHLADYMVANGVDDKLGAGSAPLEQKRLYLTQPVMFLREKLTWAFISILATWGLVLGAASGRLKATALIALATAFVVLELGWHGYRFNEPVKKEGLYAPTSPGLRFLQENLGDARFMRWGAGTEMFFMAPNAPLVYGLNDAQGFRAMTPTSYLDFMRTLEPNPHDVGLPNLSDVASFDRPHLGLLRVRYIVSAAPVPEGFWPQVHPPPDEARESSDMYIYENPSVLPRAFLVHKVHILPADEILARFREMGPDSEEINPFRTEVWLEELPAGMRSQYPEPTRESADVIRDAPGRVHVEIDTDEDSIVVLSEQYSRGWRAVAWRDDGSHEAVPVLRANHTFMAAPVRKGTRSIEFVYQPYSFKWGGVLSGLAVVLLLLVPLIGVLATPEPRI